MKVRSADGGPVAVVACGANPHHYHCHSRRAVDAVTLRRLPEYGRRAGETEAERSIWSGLYVYGSECAFALTPCPNGHRREVVQWLTDGPVLTED